MQHEILQSFIAEAGDADGADQPLVMQLLHDGFVEELDAYLSAEVQKTIRAVNKLWEKYHVSVTTLLDERKAAEDKLNGFLAQLGYIPKKEVDA